MMMYYIYESKKMIINSYISTVAQIENNNIFYKQFPPLEGI